MPVKKQYTVERVGQMDFFDNYRVPYDDDASVLVDKYRRCVPRKHLRI